MKYSHFQNEISSYRKKENTWELVAYGVVITFIALVIIQLIK